MLDSLRRCEPQTLEPAPVRTGEGSRASPDVEVHGPLLNHRGGACITCTSSTTRHTPLALVRHAVRLGATGPTPFAGANRGPSNLRRYAAAKGVGHLSPWKSTAPFSITVEEDA